MAVVYPTVGLLAGSWEMEDINVGHQVVKLSLLLFWLVIFRRFQQTDVWRFRATIIGSLGAYYTPNYNTFCLNQKIFKELVLVYFEIKIVA